MVLWRFKRSTPRHLVAEEVIRHAGLDARL
jgi:hypothetical protein